MAVVDTYGSRFMTGLDESTTFPPAKAGPGLMGGNVKCVVETVEVANGDSATSTYRLGRIPSNAIILPMSKLHYDDLQTTGSPTMDVGLFNIGNDDGITDDDNCLASAIDVAGGAGSTSLNGGDIANAGLPAWDYVASQTEDPHQLLEVIATLKTVDIDLGGTMTLELYYVEEGN